MRRTVKNAGLFILAIIATGLTPARAAVSGAIFTTVADGTIVNANTQYNSKCDVYLDGGPGANAPAKAAGLPAGDYFFQVTDPSGQTLLSTDPVNNRRFHVSTNGVITAYTGSGGSPHLTGLDQVHPELGGITIQVANTTCPTDFLDTPNTGGVYKVWVTPVTSFAGDPTLVDNPCSSGCYHGFASSASKTDNFKVKPTTPTFCASIAKQLVDFSSGTAVYSPGFNWPVTLTDPNGATNNFYTNATDGTLSICGLVAGSYTVSEGSTNGQVNTGIWDVFVNGVEAPANPIYSFTWASGQTPPSIVFQNVIFHSN